MARFSVRENTDECILERRIARKATVKKRERKNTSSDPIHDPSTMNAVGKS